ncbi:hypothetical protein GW17_00035551, partial [Ensete ventricosum]
TGAALGRRFPWSDRNTHHLYFMIAVAPTEVAFGHENSTLARSFPRVGEKGNQTQDILDEPSPKLDKEYVEPWISPGLKCEFAQDIAAINTKEKHCCILGKLNKRAVITPDMDSLLASIDSSD